MALHINFEEKEHGKGDDPVTSLQKLRDHGLDVARLPSCAPPSDELVGGSVRGCKWWKSCRFDFKGKNDVDAAGHSLGGPQWVGVQRIYPTGERKDRIKACFAFVRQKARHMDQEDVWRVIARQGQQFQYRITEATMVDAKGNKAAYREVTKKETVPYWPEPEENARLRDVLYASEAFAELEDEQERLQEAETLANISGTQPGDWMGERGNVTPPVHHGLVPRANVERRAVTETGEQQRQGGNDAEEVFDLGNDDDGKTDPGVGEDIAPTREVAPRGRPGRR